MKEIIKILRNTDRPIVIYGAGPVGERLYSVLLHDNICKPVCLCDTYLNGQGKFTGVQIISPENLKNKYPDAFICVSVANNKFKNEILHLLFQLGYSSDSIINYNELSKEILDEHSGLLSWDVCEDTFDWQQNKHSLQILASWIDCSDKSVLDIGAGTCILKELIPSDIKYIPTDYIARSPQFVIYDFNKDNFPGIKVDVCVLCGVLTWAKDWKAVFYNACQAANHKVLVATDINKENGKKALSPCKFLEQDLSTFVSIALMNGLKLSSTKVLDTEDGILINRWHLQFSK